jgi:hypothetical protein
MQVLVISWLSNPSTAEHIDESMHYIRSAAQINAAEAYLVHIEKLPKHLSEYSSRVEANFLVVLFPKSTSLRSWTKILPATTVSLKTRWRYRSHESLLLCNEGSTTLFKILKCGSWDLIGDLSEGGLTQLINSAEPSCCPCKDEKGVCAFESSWLRRGNLLLRFVGNHRGSSPLLACTGRLDYPYGR